MIAVIYLYLTLAKRPTTFTGLLVIKPIGYNNTNSLRFFFYNCHFFISCTKKTIVAAVKYTVKCIGGTSGWPPWTGGRHMEVAAKAGLTVYINIYI